METPSAAVETCESGVPATETRGMKERYHALVTRIGEEPMLDISGVGEFRFAYRNVKKKPGDPRPFLQVGDLVECRLTKSTPTKAVSVRVLRQASAPATYQHDPYSPLPEAPAATVPTFPSADNSSLFEQLGGACGISALMDEVCFAGKSVALPCSVLPDAAACWPQPPTHPPPQCLADQIDVRDATSCQAYPSCTAGPDPVDKEDLQDLKQRYITRLPRYVLMPYLSPCCPCHMQ